MQERNVFTFMYETFLTTYFQHTFPCSVGSDREREQHKCKEFFMFYQRSVVYEFSYLPQHKCNGLMENETEMLFNVTVKKRCISTIFPSALTSERESILKHIVSSDSFCPSHGTQQKCLKIIILKLEPRGKEQQQARLIDRLSSSRKKRERKRVKGKTLRMYKNT